MCDNQSYSAAAVSTFSVSEGPTEPPTTISLLSERTATRQRCRAVGMRLMTSQELVAVLYMRIALDVFLFELHPPTASRRPLSETQVECPTGRSAIVCHTWWVLAVGEVLAFASMVCGWMRALSEQAKTAFVESPCSIIPPTR